MSRPDEAALSSEEPSAAPAPSAPATAAAEPIAPGGDERDLRAAAIVERYTWGAAAAMIAVPLPGADMAATFAVWAKMISEIAHVYGFELAVGDAKRLSSDLFKGVLFTSAAWFGSAKLATSVLRFLPGAGTVTAYLIDAAIAAFGAKKVTAGVGLAAAGYFKSGRLLGPRDLAGHIKNVLGEPKTLLKALADIGVVRP